jgi:hypothetical protein
MHPTIARLLHIKPAEVNEGESASVRLHDPHRHAAVFQKPLHVRHAVLVEVENARRQRGVGAAGGEDVVDVLRRPAPPLATTGIFTASLTAAVISRS